MKKPRLLSPIQDFTSLKAAINAGADEVYFGVKKLNMRSHGARNFELRDLKKIVDTCSQKNIKTCLTVNTIVYQNELRLVERLLTKAKSSGIDAIICWDMAVLKLAKKIGLEIHLSTQASVSNSIAARFYQKLGVSRIVLARECSLVDIKKMKADTNIELEAFIHGAMCVSISGRCFMSQFLYGLSANRGQCLQPCRREYKIIDAEQGQKNELIIGADYVLSPKDLCTLPFIEKLIRAGINVFKIEGRNRSPEYVYTVTKIYRQVIDFYSLNAEAFKHLNIKSNKLLNKKFEEIKRTGLKELKTVYNRGFSDGFYLGKPINQWCHNYGSQASVKKIHLGKVAHYYDKIKVAEIKIEAKAKLKLGENIIIQGPSTGHYCQKIESIEINHKKIKQATQGQMVAVKLKHKVKSNDKVYKQIKNKAS